MSIYNTFSPCKSPKILIDFDPLLYYLSPQFSSLLPALFPAFPNYSSFHGTSKTRAGGLSQSEVRFLGRRTFSIRTNFENSRRSRMSTWFSIPKKNYSQGIQMKGDWNILPLKQKEEASDQARAFHSTIGSSNGQVTDAFVLPNISITMLPS